MLLAVCLLVFSSLGMCKAISLILKSTDLFVNGRFSVLPSVCNSNYI